MAATRRSFRVWRIGYKLPGLLVLLFFFLWKHFPEPLRTANNNRGDAPAPQYDVALKSRFLYHSRLCESPDEEYEASIDTLLRHLEEKALAESNGILETKKTIWQILLGDSFSRGADSIAFEHANTGWEYKVHLLAAYNSYPYHVLHADLVRYLLLWFHGGYYADLDIYPARPINSCPALNSLFRTISHDPGRSDISLVLGIEIDEPYASEKLMRDWHWSRSYGFVQYTMYAPRRFSPVLRRAIVRDLAHTRRHGLERVSGLRLRMRYMEKDILEITWPGVFTDAVLDLRGGRVTWAPFHRSKSPLWVDGSEAEGLGGLGVVPISVWGNGQRRSGAGQFTDLQACVNHRFGRYWKKGWWEFLFR
ncbi:hypothetical protein BDW59DRAFT_172018 [Aspergillus cavernicola]|uniref:Nucleotide-diphospho-sugar transferase n=1 Tax=Aspergillus cavernicola TaxID=176166 RepID=A0ABR4IEI6_9EURO